MSDRTFVEEIANGSELLRTRAAGLLLGGHQFLQRGGEQRLPKQIAPRGRDAGGIEEAERIGPRRHDALIAAQKFRELLGHWKTFGCIFDGWCGDLAE